MNSFQGGKMTLKLIRCARAARPQLAVTGMAFVMAVALAGCGGPPSGGSGSSPGGTAAAAGSVLQQARAVWLQYAQCVRAHGYPNFPDPVVGPGGDATLAGGPQAKQASIATESACGHILGRLPASASRQPVTPAMLAQERQLAACLRRHGLPQWPDPRPDGTFPLAGTPYKTAGGKAGPVGTAMRACRQYTSKGGQAS
jgi:hypothetical protein